LHFVNVIVDSHGTLLGFVAPDVPGALNNMLKEEEKKQLQ